MSLSERLNDAPKRRPNRGCETCHWYADLPDQDKGAFDDWLANKWSLRQLHTICSTDPDHPLTISLTALKNHVQDCLGGEK